MTEGNPIIECFTQQPSLLSIAQCIKSDFFLKSQTNFYIPPEAYAGYSYLNEEVTSHSHHGSHLFVSAEPNSLHSHQYHPHGHFMPFPSQNISIQESFLTPTAAAQTHPMTLPYIHPELQMPVPPLHLPKYFGALCFSFTLGGIMMLLWVPRWARGHWFPYKSFAWALILLQGPCSFLADYVNMTTNSPWHVIDRILACFLMSVDLVKLITMWPYTRPTIYALTLVNLAIAICCFMKSRESQEGLNTDGFIFWHSAWHCYPFLCIYVIFADRWMTRKYGEYYAFEPAEICQDEGHKRGEGGGLLLSTVVMEDFYGNVEKSAGSKRPAWKRTNVDRTKRLDLLER